MEEEEEPGSNAALQNLDTVSLILQHLSSPHDLLSAAAVCSAWRTAATDHSQLRSWTLDDSLENTVGIKTSSIPLLPKTPHPKHWINPAAHSPLASFQTPRSLMILNRPFDDTIQQSSNCLIEHLQEASAKHGLSPRTPSPVRNLVKCRPLFEIVKEKMVMGRFLGDIDIMSSRINDEAMQLILKKCPRLHTFQLLHLCAVRQNFYQEVSRMDMEVGCSSVTSCGCSPLSERAFIGAHQHCPELASVTLILQHVAFRKTLQKLLAELGKLPKLHTLSVELRLPSFGQSTKSKLIWELHTRCTEQEIKAFIKAGPPPLRALALNRCYLTEVSISALATAFPDIEALDLHSDFEDYKEQGFPCMVASKIRGLTSLSAAAFGILIKLENCHFESWHLPVLKRLRLESKDPLLYQHLKQLQAGCPQLESLHLIWSGHNGVREAHIYPSTDEMFLEYLHMACF